MGPGRIKKSGSAQRCGNRATAQKQRQRSAGVQSALGPIATRSLRPTTASAAGGPPPCASGCRRPAGSFRCRARCTRDTPRRPSRASSRGAWPPSPSRSPRSTCGGAARRRREGPRGTSVETGTAGGLAVLAADLPVVLLEHGHVVAGHALARRVQVLVHVLQLEERDHRTGDVRVRERPLERRLGEGVGLLLEARQAVVLGALQCLHGHDAHVVLHGGRG